MCLIPDFGDGAGYSYYSPQEGRYEVLEVFPGKDEHNNSTDWGGIDPVYVLIDRETQNVLSIYRRPIWESADVLYVQSAITWALSGTKEYDKPFYTPYGYLVDLHIPLSPTLWQKAHAWIVINRYHIDINKIRKTFVGHGYSHVDSLPNKT
ncbi:hypothetical protein GCM10011502_25800 [Oceanisphaera marina]|uniref:Uncharacterized protein n=1 Tax=Oceanisphaera marina TaxID=2017550 RepID=A0ABQ1IVG6_9GAMM|nr:hypothetical protein GCM10011502_25800 [Oceanisphaera marina]